MPTPNVFSAQFEYDDEDPEGYRCGLAALGRIGVWPGNDADTLMVHRADGHVPYFDGES